jgi:hypothetical protein
MASATLRKMHARFLSFILSAMPIFGAIALTEITKIPAHLAGVCC